ncbi:hypothetical protein DFP72DRAFT_1080947 [Ephemerocybe angulata]|uniref:Uncharacterized protein n=1 Tax=Ephemerocybe angulata TaxID=980116 RepID=A0A8H6HBH7_9AGAR|nr:hypothetical protein DFP72DRAFT_1080947 [Tulosesus angulatus]
MDTFSYTLGLDYIEDIPGSSWGMCGPWVRLAEWPRYCRAQRRSTTHKFSTPPDTGNFVPEGKALPHGITESLRKTEPGLQAQVLVVYDCRADVDFDARLRILETWARTKGGFNTEGQTRSSWMSPSSVESTKRFAVTSSLFQRSSAVRAEDSAYYGGKTVHPWIAETCALKPSSWIPNPNVVRFLHRDKDGLLVDIAESSSPTLVPGDVVTMTFKILFSTDGSQWYTLFTPIQIIRMGQIESSVLGVPEKDEYHGRLELPKPGQKLEVYDSERFLSWSPD